MYPEPSPLGAGAQKLRSPASFGNMLSRPSKIKQPSSTSLKGNTMKRLTIIILSLISLILGACSTPKGTASVATSPTTSPIVAAMNTAEMEKKIIDLEKKTWDLFVRKKYEESAKVIATGYQSIYFGKVKPDAEAADDNKYIDI